jgi:histidinol dehydrogenase
MRILKGAAAERYVRMLERRGSTDLTEVGPVVKRVVRTVRKEGDRALRRCAMKWDGLEKGEALRVSEDEMLAAWKSTDPELQDAIRDAAANIRQYCEWQKPPEWQREIYKGVCVGQVIRPLQSVGCYVPGGRYPLPSTLLMTVIPAQVAGVKEIRVVSPHPTQATLAAAAFLGVHEFYRIGGAQAVAALAYGTESIPRVDKIVGPGNRYVTAAKKMVAFDCAIDFLAGPTEAVFVSKGGKASYIAADLVAQAEHDADALCVFITPTPRLAKNVSKEVQRRISEISTARKSLSRRGAIIMCDSMEEAVEFSNRIAPEHLTLPEELLPLVENAGSIFLNEFTPQTAGDYTSGPSHVLPTGGMARVRGGLSVLDFARIVSVQQVSEAGLRRIGPSAITLAKAEGLIGHVQSLQVRTANA